MELARRVAKNTFYNVSALIIGNVSGLFLTIFLARILKPEQFGIYSLALSIAMLATSLSSLGIDGAVVRYTAYYVGINDIESVRGCLRHLMKIRVILSIIVSSSLIILSKALAEFFGDSRLTIPFVISGFITLFYSLMGFFDSFFKGLQRFEYSFLKQIVYEASRWVFVIPLATMYLAVGALTGFSIASAVAFTVLFIIFVLRYIHFVKGSYKRVTGRVNAFIGYMTIAGLSGLIYAYVDTVMIGYLLNTVDVGYYKAAYTIVFAVIGLISSMSNVLLPTFTQMSKKDIILSLGRINRYVSVLAFPMALSITYLAKEIISFVYGKDFIPATQAMVVLSLALIPGAFSYLATIFNARERPDVVASLITVSMILNVILNYFLILAKGIVGAALATVVSRFFFLFSVIIALYKLFGISANMRVVIKPLLASLVMLFILILLPKPNNLFYGLMNLLFAGMVYLVLIFVLKVLDRNDVVYLMSLVKR